jgi:hypothetical protein
MENVQSGDETSDPQNPGRDVCGLAQLLHHSNQLMFFLRY